MPRDAPTEAARQAHVVTSLHPDVVEATVRGWLEPYLAQHVHWWSGFLEAPMSPDDALAHVRWHGLVDEHWKELAEMAGQERAFVRCLRPRLAADAPPALPVGLVWAQEKRCEYLKTKVGNLTWLAVDPAHQGQGLGKYLMEAADAWMAKRQVAYREVFVTDTNPAAVACYASRGYEPFDTRMLGKPPQLSRRPPAGGRSE